MESIVIHGAFVVVLILMFIYLWVLTERIDKLQDGIIKITTELSYHRYEKTKPMSDVPFEVPTKQPSQKAKARKTHVHLSARERAEAYEYHLKHPNMKRQVIADYYGVHISTIHAIIRNKG